MYLSSFHVCKLASKDYFLYHMLYCLLIIFVMKFNVREKYSRDMLRFLCHQFLILSLYILYFGFGYAI